MCKQPASVANAILAKLCCATVRFMVEIHTAFNHSVGACMPITITPYSDIAALPAEISDEELSEIGAILNMYRRFDLSVYKDKCMKRRIGIRMRTLRCRDAGAYCNLLRQDPRELDLLQKALTIHVSQFFRNPSMFEFLRSEVLPELFSSAIQQDPPCLRIACLGCAGGEEPYSLALILREHFERELRAVHVSIVGTDIDAQTIKAATAAEFIEERLREVPAQIRERYFRTAAGRFQLSAEIRRMVEFRQGDIMATAAYPPAELILCRNTLIYFTRPDQEKILHGIADILPAGGILVLGKSETLVGGVRNRFEAVSPTERIYRRLNKD